MAFAAIGDTALMYRATSLAAREGRAMGIHLTYSPAVDIAWRPTNPAEGVRSFGGDLALLGRMVRSYVRGYHDNGMLSGAKHFPGRGDVERMPARPDFTWNTKSANEVRTQEFVAFKHAIDQLYRSVRTRGAAVIGAEQAVTALDQRIGGRIDQLDPPQHIDAFIVRAGGGTDRAVAPDGEACVGGHRDRATVALHGIAGACPEQAVGTNFQRTGAGVGFAAVA